MIRISAVLLLAAGVSACGAADAPAPDATSPDGAAPSTAITESLRGTYEAVKGYLNAAAEQVPEEQYAFQATAEVRTMGQLFAHIADANYMFCSASSGEAGPAESIEETRTTKADLQQALAESFAFCDRAFAAVDDVSGAAEATAIGMTSTKLGLLSLSTAHLFEHYGNIVTYMRLNGMVPPSSQPADGM